MKGKNVVFLLMAFFGVMNGIIAQSDYQVSIRNKKTISSTMWGLFFEDINRSGDGGIYPELIKNRSFDFPDAFAGWHTRPQRFEYAQNDIFQIINQAGTNSNDPKYLQVTIEKTGDYLIANEGFGGITVKQNSDYTFNMVYRITTPGLEIKVDIASNSGKIVGSTHIKGLKTSNGWQTATAIIRTSDTTSAGRVIVGFQGMGKMDIDRLSLFPTETWKKRPGGLRVDLVQKLVDIKPGFLRFPGGCIVEGEALDSRYQWKKTIGPLEERKLIINQWRDGGVSGKKQPDYYQSFGLGFMEYFQLCEDLQSEPMPILNCGISCQFGAGEVAGDEGIDEYIQDAMDLIEFANGDANSTWGSKRISLGHPEPFNMKMIGIGNENWGPQYLDRLKLFTRVIKGKYPKMQIITSTGYSPNPQFKYMDSALRQEKVDIIDEHYYQTPEWFFMNASKYDSYDRNGPRIFLGEYACHSVRIGNIGNKNTQLCALAEAAFMTGLERNCDIVSMAAYAPLFAHVKDWQWTPNLIWFDNAESYATPSYYVQKLFSLNRGTHSVELFENGSPVTGKDSIWASAALDQINRELVIKIINTSSLPNKKNLQLNGFKLDPKANVTTLSSKDRNDENSITYPDRIVPTTRGINVVSKKSRILLELEPYSFSVYRFRIVK